MVKCSAYLCENAKYRFTPGISFHTFPKDQTLCDIWIANMKIKHWKPTKFSVLCSKHFEEYYVDKSPFRTKLYPGARPTLFDFFPVSSKKEKEPRISVRERLLRKQNTTIEFVPVLENVRNTKPEPSTLQQENVNNDVENNILNASTSLSRTAAIDDSSDVLKLDSKYLKKQGGPERDRLVQRLKRTIASKNKRIKSLSEKNTRLEKKVANFSDIICDLTKKLNDKDVQTKDVQTLNNIPENNKDFLVRYITLERSSVDETYSPN